MQINGNQRRELREAITSAYPEKNKLKRIVGESDELKDNLNAIAWDDALSDVIYNLIVWAVSQGKIEDLIITVYQETPGNPELKKFYKSVFEQRFILNPAFGDTSRDIGPEIVWQGPEDEQELQSYLQPEPDYWDVGFLKSAIAQAASVCRVEIPSQGIQGTGVLITDRLVLTNYHVLKPENLNADIQNNALNTILRFGYFSSDSGNETDGRVFQLDKQKPILHFSRTDKLDYVLLQVEENILNVEDIKPARWGANDPVERQGINLLQHPEGQSMKLSISRDGITKVDPEKGLVQYVNKTARGSSGAPCFDENWQIVALHRAEQDKIFHAIRGKIREGILFSAIYKDLKKANISL